MNKFIILNKSTTRAIAQNELNGAPVSFMDADVVRGECRDVCVELEDDAPPSRVVVVVGGGEPDGGGRARRVEAQGALVRVQRVRVEPSMRDIHSVSEFANRLKRLNLAIFVNVIMGIFLYLANPPEVLYGTMIYDRILIQKDGLQKRP